MNDTSFWNEKRCFWLLAAACVVSLFLFLGDTLFNTRGEPREAVVALSMLKSGNWILPVNNGVDLAYKPPLFHWVAALCSLPFGRVSEYTARIPSALGLTAMVLAGYRFYAKRSSVAAALLMGLLTLTNFETHRAGVAARVDMVLACMMVLSLYALYIWAERGMKRFPWLAVLALSGAFLSKGPVGAALPCVVVWIYVGIRTGRWFGSLLRFVGIGLASCVLPLAWYVAAYMQGGERFWTLIYEENVLRLLGRMTYESHVNPWPYNVMTIVAGFVPYTLLVLFSLFAMKYRKPDWFARIIHGQAGKPLSRLADTWARFKAYVRNIEDYRLFTFLSFAIIFVFYCIPKSKRSVYLLPVYPFLAYYLAEYILYLRRRHMKVLMAFGGTMCGIAIVLTLTFLAMRAGLIPETLLGGRHAEQNVLMLRALRSTPLSPLQWCVFAVPVVAAVYFVVRKRAVAGTVALVFAVFLSLDGVYQPLVLNTKSDKPQADFLAALQPTGQIYSYRTDITKGNEMHPFTLNFYLGDRVVPFEAFMPERGLLLTGNEEITAFEEHFPAYRVRLVRDFAHRSCDDHKMLKLYEVERKR